MLLVFPWWSRHKYNYFTYQNGGLGWITNDYQWIHAGIVE